MKTPVALTVASAWDSPAPDWSDHTTGRTHVPPRLLPFPTTPSRTHALVTLSPPSVWGAMSSPCRPRDSGDVGLAVLLDMFPYHSVSFIHSALVSQGMDWRRAAEVLVVEDVTTSDC